MNRRINGIVLLLIFSTIFAAPIAAQSNNVDAGIQAVAIIMNGEINTQISDSVIIPKDKETRLSILYQGTQTGDSTYMIRAPFASTIMTTDGVITDEKNGIHVLKISLLQGLSFTLDVIGSTTETSYIDVVKVQENNYQTISHIILVPDGDKGPEPKEPEPGTYGPLTLQIAIAQKNLDDLKKLGNDYPLFESQLENAKFYSRQENYEKATPLIDSVISKTSNILDRYAGIQDRIETIKGQAETTGTLDEISPYIVRAEQSLANMDLDESERLLSQAETIANPGMFKHLLNTFGLYFIIGAGVLLILLVLRRFLSTGRKTPNIWS